MPAAETVKEFVLASHFDLNKVQTMLAEDPTLVAFAHEWGPGDLEDGIGAAAHVGNVAIAEYLLSQGAPGNICVSAMLGKLDEVRDYLSADPSLANARGAHGISVMFHAAMSGSTEITSLLKEKGCTEGYSHALHGAINHGHQNMVEWLLENGATELDVLNYQGKTPVARALESDQLQIAELLRQHGASH
ncbi:MAG: ankyrin repeat domain-containing protein [Anaerolineae bacterium]|nr:ankyrin repeat domain-containing protein [Anaerolineae bacterium]